MELENLKSEIIKLVSNASSSKIKLLNKIKNSLKNNKLKTDPDKKFTKEDIDVLFPHVKETSRKSYYAILKNFTQNELIDYEATIKKIDNMEYKGHKLSVNTKRSYYAPILGYFTNVLDYPDIKEFYWKEYEKCIKQLDTTPKSKLYVTYEDLDKKIDSIKNKDIEAYVALYLQYKFPLRSDFRTVKVRNYNKSTDNFVNIETGLLIFNYRKKYSESITFDLKYELPPKEYSIIESYIKGLDRDYLFVNTQGQDMVKVGYFKFIRRCGKRIGLPELTVNDFRYAYVSHYIGNELEIQKIENHNKRLGHSLRTAIKYYLRESI